MKTITTQIEALVWWLRRPERFIQKARVILKEHPVTLLRDLEQIAHQLRIEILHADLGPRIYGAITRDAGQPIIVLQPGLNPWHREFTFAHEMGHAQLHLPEMPGPGILSSTTRRTAGAEDVEADTYVLLCVGLCLSERQFGQEIAKYVFANPNMIRRGWRIIRYFLFYNLRIRAANLLERLFLTGQQQEPPK